MRIADSNISMASARMYQQKDATRMQQTVSGSAASFSGLATRTAAEAADGDMSGNLGGLIGNTGSGIAVSSGSNAMDELINIKNSLLQILLKRLSLSGMTGRMGGLTAGAGGYFGFGTQGQIITQVHYYESEQTSFSAKGYATTEDGRTLDFQVELSMTRSFMEYSQIQMPRLAGAMLDPLMINVGSGVTHISDQSFLFDLDMDGEAEEISMPDSGTGFLALDLNGDGVINDGSELFGAKSGDGFADLAVYDSDGNGWIDENDDIYDKLRVWYRHPDGTDELVDLKSADVGAIFLGKQDTDFSLYGADMRMNGMVRATGLFLRESGGTGTVQHVDLAVHTDDDAGLFGAEDDDTSVTENGTVVTTGTLQTGEGSGALLINTSDSTDDSTDGTTDSRRNSTTVRDREAERAKQMQRRAEEALRRKEQTKRYFAHKELLKEQIEKIFEDRAQMRKDLNEQAAEEAMEETERNGQLIVSEMEHAQELDALLNEQLEFVA